MAKIYFRNTKEWKKLMLAGDQLKKSNIYIDDSPGVTIGDIKAKSRRIFGLLL